ncbi:alpha-2-macroglobulin family protein [Aureimonas psammosilenae]|uniref:alpha-2-macroglobulin family protein n=1 Tax=Aureimonas psammosilenae TaxID=2495496 RepID=UPI001F2DA2DD|nr:alpha-2-macroglobulin family protein [Aureimonas psammosilenae]
MSFLTALMVLAAHPGTAAERRIVPAPQSDYVGGDYDMMRDVDRNLCETACLADTRCKAFTFNTKAKACFLKETLGELRSTPVAEAGRIVESEPPSENVEAERLARLAFLPKTTLDAAKALRTGIGAEKQDDGLRADRIMADAKAALAQSRFGDAARLFREQLKREPGDAEAWKGLAGTALAFGASPNGVDTETAAAITEARTPAAIAAFATAPDDADAALALDLLAQGLGRDESWGLAIRVWRESVKLAANASVRQRLDEAVAAHGFRIAGNTVDNNAAAPRICFTFSENLAASVLNGDTAGDYLRIEGGDTLPVSARGNQICVDGVEHGRRYHIQVRAGLSSESGETLPKTADTSIYVRDRDPSVRFASNAYVLPAGGEATIPVTTINTDKVKARLLRLGDRSLATTIGAGRFLSQMERYEADEIAGTQGEEVWQGSVDVSREVNAEVTTAIPVSALVKDLKPGVYILTARAENQPQEDYSADATQWFVLTDLGLTSFAGEDGLHVFARSLGSAEALKGIELQLVARNNEILGTATTDDEGHARFAPGLMKGLAGDGPAVLMASRERDFSFLDLTASPFDLTDRGVEGRAKAGPLDVFLTSDRGIYRTGDVVNLTALLRDGQALASQGLTLTGIATRPDGVEFRRETLTDGGAGGLVWSLALPQAAMRGVWRFALHTDPKRPALATTSVRVEDFEPQRLAFDLKLEGRLDPAAPPPLPIDVNYLFGAPAPNLAVEGEAILRPASNVPGFEAYSFGLSDDQPTPTVLPIEPVTTGEDGHAEAVLAPFEAPVTTRPLEAAIRLRVTDPGGRPVEREAVLPVETTKTRIGIRPLFAGSVGDGEQAGFTVVALGLDGKATDLSGARWVLSRVIRDYQWYRSGGRWNYEPIERVERVSSGTADLKANEPANLSLPVSWGSYRLEISDASGAALPASVGFDAGWYVAARSAETPDILKLSLDKPRYAVGDTAVVHIEPRFAGKAEVLVMDDRVVQRVEADIPAEGADVTLDVTHDWGPGAYVTAVLYRPMSIAEKQMPGRAIGLAYAGVDPGERALTVSIEAPATVKPRGVTEALVKVAGIQSGETAYLTLAAVDQGILNVTDFQPPAPKDWYFGRKRLGVDIRDLYSKLIDRMQGAPGAVRSGGDAGASIASPPPMDDLVSLFSGLVTVEADGTARVPLDLPDFQGQLKLMAVVWSKTGVGEASADMVVRDPIVMQVSQPRFLAPGDTSRISVDVTHVEGPVGRVALALTGGEGVVAPEANAASTLDLTEKGHGRVLVPIRADHPGDAAFDLALTTPDGAVLHKSFVLPVRSLAPEVLKKSRIALVPSTGKLTVGADSLSDFVPGTGRVALTVTPNEGFDIAGLVRALDLYPYGCTEQITSRALPLVYLDQTVVAAGLGQSRAGDVKERVQKAVGSVLANQSSSGAFGLWSPGEGDLWLDSYVSDFLTRAREAGYAVPEEGLTLALDNLRNSLAYLPEKPDWGPVAYAYYVLARNGRAAIGDLRYTADTQLGDFPTPLAKAQLGAALALYGDRVRAQTVLKAAVSSAAKGEGDAATRTDYGTSLRDGAAVLTLALETRVDGVGVDPLIAKVGRERAGARYSSTQEDAWSLLAAHALLGGKPLDLAVNGQPHQGSYVASFDAGDLATPLELANRSDAPAYVELTVAGVPVQAPPAESAGFDISVSYYSLEGKEIDASTVGQGERVVAVVEAQPGDDAPGRLMIDVPLAAGFEIDNPAIVKGGDVGALDFLELSDAPAHVEFRADRFLAAVDKPTGDTAPFRFAFILRAVSPGTFADPAASVFDMYRPERRARTEAGSVTIVGARQ